MNKNIVRILALLLAALMLTVCFVGCQDNPDQGNEGGESTEAPAVDVTQGGDDTQGGETEAPEQSIEDILGFDLEDHNTDINFLYAKYDNVTECFYAESFDGDEVAVEVYERNLAVEENLGVKINFIESDNGTFAARSDFRKQVENAVQAGTNDYDLVTGMSVALSTMMFSGLFYDFNEIETIDLGHSWWMKDATETYGIDDKVFGMVGDIAHSYYSCLGIMAANTNLLDKFGVAAQYGSLYDLVYDGKWTLDKLLEIGAAYGEENGDGNMVLGDDVFGFVSRSVPTRLFMYSFGIELIQREADGSVALVEALDEKTINSYQKLYDALNMNKYSNIANEPSKDKIVKHFADNKAMIIQAYFSDLGSESIRNMESEYMVLPQPKYDENQDDYIVPLATEAAMVMIPTTASDEELSGKVFEYMGYLGEKDITPVYIEQTLKLKYAADPQVMEMVQYIVDRSSYTLTAVLIWNFEAGAQMRNMYAFGSLNIVGSPNITSTYSTYRRAWKKELTNLLGDLG